MDWTIALAALLSTVCLAAAAALALWSAGRALPEGRPTGLARHVGRTADAARGPGPVTLRVLAGVFVLAGALPWGLAAPPDIGRWRFVFPALGVAFLSAWTVPQGARFTRNDRRLFAPLSLALAAGYAALLGHWFA